jgi:succinate-acetate transporter protein
MLKKASTIYLHLAMIFLGLDIGLITVRVLTIHEKGLFCAFGICLAIYITLERFFNEKGN